MKIDKMYIVQKFETQSISELKDCLIDWLFFIRITASPITFRFGQYAVEDFNFNRLKDKILALTEQEETWIKVNAEEGEFQIHIVANLFLEKTVINMSSFLEKQEIIENYCDTRIEKNGIFGFIRPLDDYLYNNVEKVEKRIFENKSETEKLPKRYNEKKEVVVDCNQFAGFDLYYKELCFTSCWKMYFSEHYFRWIPKPIFLEIQQVESIEELNNQHIKITLFRNPLNWSKEVNQSCQRLFRDQLGFDQLGWNNGIGVLRPPFIEYAFTEEGIQTVQYQNQQFQPVEKKKATHFVMRSYSFVSKDYKEKRNYGFLKAQAYFPWIDEENQKMMNYRVLNPNLTIDNGLLAYEFYIRQFLEIEITDDKYQSFTSVLRFYLPKESIETVPVAILKNQLNDIKISNLKQQEHSTYFDLKKAKNHLRVVFLEYNSLETIHETLEEGE